MYCGNNKTACASQLQIANALLALLEEKPYSEISVSELCKKAGISRQTFYSLFSSMDNVIVYLLQNHGCYAPAAPEESASCLQALCREYCMYMIDQSDFIRTLVENHIIFLLYDSIYESLSAYPCFFEDFSPSKRSYVANFLAGGFTSIAKNYVMEGQSADVEFLTSICLDLFEGRLLS